MALDERDYMRRRNADDPYYRPKEFRRNRRGGGGDGGFIDWDAPVFGISLQSMFIGLCLVVAVLILLKKGHLDDFLHRIGRQPVTAAPVYPTPVAAPQPAMPQAVQAPVESAGNASQADGKMLFYGQQMIKRSPDGHYYLPGKVNGTPVVFMLDTGASVTFISSQTAISAGITSCTKVHFVTAMGVDPDACMAKAQRLDFGNFTISDIDIGISKNLSTNPLLGMNALKQLKMVQSGDTLLLESNL